MISHNVNSCETNHVSASLLTPTTSIFFGSCVCVLSWCAVERRPVLRERPASPRGRAGHQRPIAVRVAVSRFSSVLEGAYERCLFMLLLVYGLKVLLLRMLVVLTAISGWIHHEQASCVVFCCCSRLTPIAHCFRRLAPARPPIENTDSGNNIHNDDDHQPPTATSNDTDGRTRDNDNDSRRHLRT